MERFVSLVEGGGEDDGREPEPDLDGTEDHGGGFHMTTAESMEVHDQAPQLIGQARRQGASAS